jgi:hypothetical protein
MFTDAWNELEELVPETRHSSQVILLRVMIYNNLQRWEEAAIIGTGRSGITRISERCTWRRRTRCGITADRRKRRQ